MFCTTTGDRAVNRSHSCRGRAQCFVLLLSVVASLEVVKLYTPSIYEVFFSFFKEKRTTASGYGQCWLTTRGILSINLFWLYRIRCNINIFWLYRIRFNINLFWLYRISCNINLFWLYRIRCNISQLWLYHIQCIGNQFWLYRIRYSIDAKRCQSRAERVRRLYFVPKTIWYCWYRAIIIQQSYYWSFCFIYKKQSRHHTKTIRKTKQNKTAPTHTHAYTHLGLGYPRIPEHDVDRHTGLQNAPSKARVRT